MLVLTEYQTEVPLYTSAFFVRSKRLKTEERRCDNPEKNTITLEGNVTLNQKNNIISGKKLLFNTENGDIQMFGPVKTILNEEKNN